MGLAPVRSYEIYDIASRVRNAIPGWKLPDETDRAALTESLFKYLNKELGGYPMKKNFAAGGTLADIVISEEVVIEFCEDFTAPAHLKALQKRLEDFKMWQGIILVLFCGKVSSALRTKLDDYINGLNNDRWYSSVKEIVTYVKVAPAKAASGKKQKASRKPLRRKTRAS